MGLLPVIISLFCVLASKLVELHQEIAIILQSHVICRMCNIKTYFHTGAIGDCYHGCETIFV